MWGCWLRHGQFLQVQDTFGFHFYRGPVVARADKVDGTGRVFILVLFGFCFLVQFVDLLLDLYDGVQVDVSPLFFQLVL